MNFVQVSRRRRDSHSELLAQQLWWWTGRLDCGLGLRRQLTNDVHDRQLESSLDGSRMSGRHSRFAIWPKDNAFWDLLGSICF